MNAIQFQTAILESQQRARTAIGAFMEAMQPPQMPQQQGQVQNAPTPKPSPQLQGQEIGQRPNPAGPVNLPPG